MNLHDINSSVVIFSILGGIATFISLAFYLVDRKKSWKGCKGKRIPQGRLIPKEFQFNDYYIRTDIDKVILEWAKNPEKHLLLIGPSGVGKSRAIVEFFKIRGKNEKVFVLAETDIREKQAPFFTRNGYVVLDDAHLFQHYSLSKVLEETRFKIIATIPDDKTHHFSESFSLFKWEHIKLEKWTKDRGEELAKQLKKESNMPHFNGTPLSVIAPTAHMKRLFDRAEYKQRIALTTLKMAKECLGCFVDVQLIIELASDTISPRDVETVLDRWCLKKNSQVFLRDVFDECIPVKFGLEDCERIFDRLSKIKNGHLDKYYFYLGISFFRYEAKDRAISCWDKSTDINPDDNVAWILKGRLLFDLGRVEEALEAYNISLKLNHNESVVWALKGYVLFDLGRVEEALEAAEMSLKLNPDDSNAWSVKGLVLVERGRVEEALEAVEMSLKLNPDDSNAWSVKGRALVDLGRVEEALEAYSTSLKLNPKNSNAWGLKGCILSDEKKFKEALEAVEMSLKLNPHSSDAWWLKGIVLTNLEKFEEALEAVEMSLKLNPHSSDAWWLKGNVLAILSLSEEALSLSEEA
ncbi:MAG: tetratricopeptide repeat protein, partial [Candidatus Thermoplasmatota archaeon]|nr:tetratricopeptide repeat protein [Candidatus Thermoplasmatota archaeon]